jgi:hypothetical protein
VRRNGQHLTTHVEVRSRIPGDDGLPAVLIELAEETTTTRELIRRP